MIPSFESFLLPMLRLHSDCKVRSVTDSTNELSKIIGFSEEDWEVMTRSGNKSQIADRCYWSLTYLKQAGLLEQPLRCHYQITVAGLELLERPIEQLNRQYLEKNYPSFLSFSKERKRKKSENTQNDNLTLFDEKSSIKETV
jgi:restriction system protein